MMKTFLMLSRGLACLVASGVLAACSAASETGSQGQAQAVTDSLFGNGPGDPCGLVGMGEGGGNLATNECASGLVCSNAGNVGDAMTCQATSDADAGAATYCPFLDWDEVDESAACELQGGGVIQINRMHYHLHVQRHLPVCSVTTDDLQLRAYADAAYAANPKAFDPNAKPYEASRFWLYTLGSSNTLFNEAEVNDDDVQTETLSVPGTVFTAPTSTGTLTYTPPSGPAVVTPMTCKPWGFRTEANPGIPNSEDQTVLIDPALVPAPFSEF